MIFMARMDFLRQGGTPFDQFLYAGVGEDRSGATVSVLSTLARLGLDPWDEAADLSDLPRAGARSRLGGLLARFGDVPALGSDHGSIAQRLIELLPKTSGRQSGRAPLLSSPAVLSGIGPILGILMLLVILAQAFFFGSSGTGD